MPVPASDSLMLFLHEVLQDMENLCSTSTTRDEKTITSRVEHEGLSFLTITLPAFAKDFERSLELGRVAPSLFAGFSRKGCLPRFLGGFTSRVFDRGSGLVLDDPSVDHIFAIRQICLVFSKILLSCSNARRKKAFRGYIECEKEVAAHSARGRDSISESFQRLAALAWGNILSAAAVAVDLGLVHPQHGNGSTADRLSGNRKWDQMHWTRRLEITFPSSDWLIPNARYYQDLDPIHLLEPEDETPVKVILVPKTLKSPRVIAMEPTCMMYVQRGFMSTLYDLIEADDFASTVIGWSSSTRNHEMARLGSEDGSFATLDLSEASDRVSVQHVEDLLCHFQTVLEAVMACRSSKAEVPGFGVITLAKYASMGSALTFPLEAMVFATAVFVGIEQALTRRLTLHDLQILKDRVRVYGDDIIVPVEFVAPVQAVLKHLGFKINADKSFWSGKFRESCGKEYFSGHDVSIVRVRRTFPTNRRHVREIESTVALRNHLYWNGLWRSAAFLDRWLKRLIPFPIVESTSHVLGRESVLRYKCQRVDPRLHRPLVRGCVVRTSVPSTKLDGVFALLKCLVVGLGLPNQDTRHLERAGRPRSSCIKTGWYTPY